MNRALNLPQQPSQQRIGPGFAAKESNLDPAGQLLVDQHPNMLFRASASLSLGGVTTSWNQRAHVYSAHILDDAVGGRVLGDTGSRRPVRARPQPGRKFPVGEMASKDQRRFVVEAQLRKQFV